MLIKIGAVIAAVYLLIVFLVSMPLLFDVIINGSEGGLHSASAMSMLFTMILTSPISWAAVSGVDTYFGHTAKSVQGFLVAGGLSISALTNAAVIYLFFWIVSRIVRGPSKKVPHAYEPGS